MEKKVKVTISIPENLLYKAKAYARSQGASFSGVVRVALGKELYDKGIFCNSCNKMTTIVSDRLGVDLCDLCGAQVVK